MDGSGEKPVQTAGMPGMRIRDNGKAKVADADHPSSCLEMPGVPNGIVSQRVSSVYYIHFDMWCCDFLYMLVYPPHVYPIQSFWNDKHFHVLCGSVLPFAAVPADCLKAWKRGVRNPPERQGIRVFRSSSY